MCPWCGKTTPLYSEATTNICKGVAREVERGKAFLSSHMQECLLGAISALLRKSFPSSLRQTHRVDSADLMGKKGGGLLQEENLLYNI